MKIIRVKLIVELACQCNLYEWKVIIFNILHQYYLRKSIWSFVTNFGLHFKKISGMKTINVTFAKLYILHGTCK